MPGYLGLFRRFILRDLGKDWIRTSLTIAGIALGVCVLLAISLANYTALAKFRETVDLVSGKANLEIRSTSAAGVDEKVLKELEWLWTVGGKFTPIIQDNVIMPSPSSGDFKGRQGEDGLPSTLRENADLVQMLGIDLLCDADFKRFQTTSDSNEFLSLFTPDAVLIGQRLATKHHLQQGSHFNLLINDQLKPFKVNGILSSEGLGGAFSGNCVVADISTAQTALQKGGKITQVEIIVKPDDLGWVQKKLQDELPKSLSITRPSQRGEQVEKITRSFEYNLTALTLIALMVGMFLIYKHHDYLGDQAKT